MLLEGEALQKGVGLSRYRVVKSGRGWKVLDGFTKSFYPVTFLDRAVADRIADGANADAAAAVANSRLARVA
jgi:hypothetical protein